MNTIFTDTSAFVAFFDRSDKNHSRTKILMERIKKHRIKLLVSDYVFDETITTVLCRADRDLAVKVGEYILNSNIIDLVWLSELHKMRAWEYFKKHSDKEYSFTDCTSFVFMKEKGINNYFAFDNHFKEAGFLNFSHRYSQELTHKA